MNPLIIYYSHTGNNEKLAMKIKAKLGCDILRIDEKKKRKTISILFDFMAYRKSKLKKYSVAGEKYDGFILISPVWGEKVAAPLRTFLEKEKGNIKNYSYITICNGYQGQKEKLEDELLSITANEPVNVTELWVNLLLPEEKQNKIIHTFNFRASDEDLDVFEKDIEAFIGAAVNG